MFSLARQPPPFREASHQAGSSSRRRTPTLLDQKWRARKPLIRPPSFGAPRSAQGAP